MPYQEKSAWLMTVILGSLGFGYFSQVWSLSTTSGQLAPPTLPAIISFTVALVIASIVAHIVIAVFSPTDVNEPSDEREKRIFDRAGHWSGYVLVFGVVTSLGHYLFTAQDHVLFYGVFASLILSQLAEYIFQIYFYRSRI